MKVLVVSQDFPWPPTYGSRLRLEQVLEVATSLGETDLFSLVSDPWGDSYMVPDDVRLRRVQTALRVVPRYTLKKRAQFVASRELPIEIAVARSGYLESELRVWADDHYDVVWFSKGATFDLLGRPRLGPTIVDLDDLEDRKIAAQLAATGGSGFNGRTSLVMFAGAQAQARLNAKRWRALQKTIAGSVEKVVLCSALDAERFAEPNTAIVVNGYDMHEHPAGTIPVKGAPTILLQGSLRYAPNADAARWLAMTIAPAIREQLPSLEVRLVGDPDGSVMSLDDPPHVTVVGRVPEMRPELERAHVIAVPLRYGSGTRLKILEAMAHRIPVVSTTIGAEGLGLRAGEHLLVADDADEFAKACVELLSDEDRRRSLTEAAHEEFLRNHHWGVAREQIRCLLLETAGAGAR
jgi:glycosyltransferase involved in cell wall biosynthesis